MRLTSCSADISSEKMHTALPVFAATLEAIFSTKEVFPIPGRAPTRIRSDFPIPASTLSSPPKPVDSPCDASPFLCRAFSCSYTLPIISRMLRKLRVSRPCAMAKIRFSASSRICTTESCSE